MQFFRWLLNIIITIILTVIGIFIALKSDTEFSVNLSQNRQEILINRQKHEDTQGELKNIQGELQKTKSAPHPVSQTAHYQTPRGKNLRKLRKWLKNWDRSWSETDTRLYQEN